MTFSDIPSNQFPEDADDGSPNHHSDSDSSEENDDDEAELLRELEKIKKEREAEEMKQMEVERKQEEVEEHAQRLRANPLLLADDVSLRRRWDDDYVFKNQNKNPAPAKKQFINDTVRSEFHKKFLTKYIL
eukprot:GHVN01077925.1.p4 GENE.GHVN01077925.1~~GHVN01077925.1.p4  ORF type:complete len:131 (+),score=35.74 GHVN01077925.1:2177-2569(+)